MKHYSAELVDLNDVAAGANLEIADGRTRGVVAITAGAGTDVATEGSEVLFADNRDGLVISGGNFSHILDGQGSSFDPNVGTKAAAGPVNLIRHISFDTATNMLLFDYDSDFDGRNVDDDADVAADFTISLSSLAGGGGGGGASTNPTDYVLPIKVTTGVVDTFIDSQLSTAQTGYASESGLTVVKTNATTLTISGGTSLTDFAADDAVTLNQIHPDTGAVTTVAATVMTGSTPTATGLVLTITSGADDDIDANEPVGVFKLGAQADVTIDNDVIITGDLQILGTQTTVNQQQVEINDSFILLNAVDPDAPTSDLSDLDGGIIVLTDVVASTDAASYAGIRYNAGDTAWEIATDLNSDDGSDGSGTWKPLVCVPEVPASNPDVVAVFKVAGNFPAATQTASTSQLGIVVATASGTTTWAITHNLGNNDVIVSIYDNNNNQIIPDEITAASGVVTISLPGTAAAYSTDAQHRFVIIG